MKYQRMPLWAVWLSPHGRISRSTFWLLGFLPILVVNLVGQVIDLVLFGQAGVLTIVCAALTIWPEIAIFIKRLHDRDRSGWFALLGVVPIANIWLAVEVGFLKGTIGENRFGPETAVDEPTGPFLSVFKRELRGYFAAPQAYLFLVVFLVFCSGRAFDRGFFEIRQASLSVFFDSMPLLFIFLAPAMAMRLWAEERRSNSIELLFSLPITATKAVLAKFFAAWTVLTVGLALTFPMVLTVAYLGNPDPGPIVTGYLASFLLAGTFLAIGGFFSCLTRNQVVAFVLGVAACLLFLLAGSPNVLNFLSRVLPAGLVGVVETLSFQSRFESMQQRGVIELRDVAFFVLLAAGWLWATMVALKERLAAG